jgi:hypothetical protein
MSDASRSLLLDSGHPLLQQFLALVKTIDKESPAPGDVQTLRAMLDQQPDLWRVAGDLSRAAALDIVNQLRAGPVVSESLKRGWGALQDELGYASASPLERLMIEQIALCWLDLHIVQLEYTRAQTQPMPTSDADHWDRRLSAAQQRYLRACDALARIRKLDRTTPALQVNIAAAGSQQVNLLSPEPAREPG